MAEHDRAWSTYITSLGFSMNPDSWTASEDGEGFWTESKSQFSYCCVPECVKRYLNRVKLGSPSQDPGSQLCRQRTAQESLSYCILGSRASLQVVVILGLKEG